MRHRLAKFIPFGLAILLIVASSPYAAESATTQLTVLHVNDYHGRVLPFVDNQIDPQKPVGGAAYMAAMIKAERAQNPGGAILLAAGDMFQGSPVSNLFHGAPVIKVMNELRFDAMALGNHEFDWGMAALTRLRKQARFPFLSANIVDRHGHLLPGIRPYIILQRKHTKIAIIGLTTPETGYTTKPDNVRGLTFLSAGTVLPRLITTVRQQGACIVIALSHMGFDADKVLASSVAGIDVIVGGHSHTEVPEPYKAASGTIIVQAGAYGVYLGVLQLNIDASTGKVTGYTDRSGLKLVSAGSQDKADRQTALIVKTYSDLVKKPFAAMVGETTVDLVAGRTSETNLGNLVADAMREDSGAQIAFENSGGIRANIPSGKITMEQLYNVLPFDNVIVSMNLAGARVKEVLEQGGAGEFGLLQMSGINVTYDLSRPSGDRVTKAEINGKPLDPGKTYTVVTNDFLAAGGDKVTTLKQGENLKYGDTLRDAVRRYLKTHSPVAPKVEGRIQFRQQ